MIYESKHKINFRLGHRQQSILSGLCKVKQLDTKNINIRI